MSKVAVIGYGNLGFHLAKRLSKEHYVAVFSRNPSEKHVMPLSSLKPDGFDFLILTVPDDLVKEVSNSIKTSETIVLHTSGFRPLSDLDNHKKKGVLYPLQTFSKAKNVNFDTLQLCIEGTVQTEGMIVELANSIGNEVKVLNSLTRRKIHLAAVFACNFSNHMFHIAENILEEVNFSFQDIRSLVEETVEKAMEINPSNAQTGPAIRDDVSTLSKHEELIKDDLLKELYAIITKSIQTRK